MRRPLSWPGILAVMLTAVSTAALAAGLARAQEQVALYAVEPSAGTPGEELVLTLIGKGFGAAREASVAIEGIEVMDVQVESDETIKVRVFIPPETPLGPRPVVLQTPNGQAVLEDGLTVLSEAPPGAPAPTPAPDASSSSGSSFLLLTGGALLVWAAGFAVGRAATIRSQFTWKRLAEVQWQVKASTQLPEPKEACTWTCKADASIDLLNRWEVAALELTPLPVSGGKKPEVKQVTGEPLKVLGESIRIGHVLEDETRTRQRLAPLVDALLQEILAWKQEGMTPAAIRLDARMKREVKCGFHLYHCEKTKKGLQWKERKKWKKALHQPGGECVGVLRGPTAGEADFSERARAELETLLLQLVKGVRLKL